jgi:hypothetical protein
MVFVAYMFLASLITVFGLIASQELALLFGLAAIACYLLPNLLCSISMSMGTNRVAGSPLLAPLAFVVTPLYHASYGLGWWVGLAKIVGGAWRRYLGAAVDYQIQLLPPLDLANLSHSGPAPSPNG